jgi:Na+/melibiose symporter-like transporter
VPGEQANGILPRPTESTDGSNLSTLPTIFPFLRFLLNDPVRLALLNYGLLAFLDAAFRVLLPLFLVISIASYPFFIGEILATMGLVGFLVQAVLFAPLHRLLGSRLLYSLGLCSFGILFATFAFIVKADSRGSDFLSSSGSALIALQMILYPIVRMPFRKHILPLERT